MDNAPIVIEYPAWHDKVREEKKANPSIKTAELADRYGVSMSRISQILSPGWKLYFLAWRSKDKSDKNLSSAKLKLTGGNYLYVPKDIPSPAAAERSRKIVKALQSKKQPTEDQPMAPVRQFETVKEIIEGKSITGGRIRCSKCPNTLVYRNYKGTIVPNYLEKEFTRRGWLVGRNASTDLCPDCRAKLNGKKDIPFIPNPQPVKALDASTSMSSYNAPVNPPAKEPVMETPAAPIGIEGIKAAPVGIETVAAPVAEERKMTRSDDQIITAKLFDVYINETDGYKADWTDAKVAEDLGVPVAWVALVRDRSFGPEINSSMRAKQEEGLRKMREDIDRTVLLVDKKLEQLQLLDSKVSDVIDKINSYIDRFDELQKSLITEDKHVENLIADFNAKVAQYKEICGSTVSKP